MFQLGDDKDMFNVIQYEIGRCKRFTRSVLTAELQALVLGLDYCNAIADMLQEKRGRKIAINAYVYSKMIFYVVTRYCATNGKILQIDMLYHKKSYERG